MPGYNWTPEWLNQQREVVHKIIEAARTDQWLEVEYDDERHRAVDQLYYQNILASMRVHHPGVADNFRTWLRRDHMTGTSILCIGDASHYNPGTRKTTRGQRTPKLRGSVPLGPVSTYTGPSLEEQMKQYSSAVTKPVLDTYVYGELGETPLTDILLTDKFIEGLKTTTLGKQRITFKPSFINLSKDGYNVLLAYMTEWADEDNVYDEATDRVTSLTLRRRTEASNG